MAASRVKRGPGKIWALAVHGGAGAMPGVDYERSERHMADLLRKGGEMLSKGASAVDAVCEMVQELEACGLHVAGKGSSPNKNGDYELDAAVMDGETRNAGAVAALKGLKHPILAARAVMDHSPHVMLVGEGAYEFARAHKLKRVKSPDSYYEPAASGLASKDGDLAHGTVGAVALDSDGLLASATSTGGVLDKAPGRVGDSPIIGAGLWADERVAVSCTGIGEYFIRTSAASDVSSRMKYARRSVDQATQDTLDDISFLGGEGGMIAIDCLGRISTPFNTKGMKRGFIHADGAFKVATFR